MRVIIPTIIGFAVHLFFVCSSAAAEPPASLVIELERLLTKQKFEEMGLHKLSETELASLNKYIAELVIKYVTESTTTASDYRNRPFFLVEASDHDDVFVINGNNYRARTYCFNVEVGDRVVFIKGSAWGTCTTATFINLRTGESCEVWCE